MTAPTPAGEEMGKLLERAREIAADDVSAMTASWVDTQAFARALLSSPRVERARALEEAAKVADEYAQAVDNPIFARACAENIASRIRSLSPTDKQARG